MPGFSSTYSPLFLTVILILSGGISYFFYRKSFLSNSKKYFLISLKAIAIFLLLTLLIEPVLSSLVKNDSSKLNIILIDNSRSNSLSFQGAAKDDEIKKILSENNILNSDFKVYSFSNSVIPLNSADSFISAGYETDLEAALKSLKNAYPSRMFNSVTIISDGIFNTGGNPLYEAKKFQAPFITVVIGDTNRQKDIVVAGALYNEKAFTNTPAKVKVLLDIYKYAGGTVKVELLREGSVISSKNLDINSGVQNYETDFDITENTPGKIKYRVQAEHKEDEFTYKNNYYDFYITYIDNKVNIMVISGGPGYDNEFAGSVLKRIGNYNTAYRTSKSPGEFYEGTIDQRSFAELSAVFLLNYPASQSAANTVQDITNYIRMFKTPVVFFAGKNTDYQKLNSLDELIPFTLSRPSSAESLFSLQIVNSDNNPLLKLPQFGSTAQIFRNVSGVLPKPGAVTLATDRATGEPVMMTRTSGEYKSTAFLGYGLWRWRLNQSADAEKTLESFLIEAINMTLQKEKKTKFRIYPAKDIFDLKQRVRILAEVYDENFLPTRNATVKGKITKADGTKIAELNFTIEENKYSANVSPLLPGDYIAEADAELGNSYYASDKSRFSVDSLNTEFIETRTNSGNLRELSENTGGKVINTGAYNTIESVIKETVNNRTQETELRRQNRFNLWENKFVLGLIIMLFSLEWVLRKRNNIP